jgi:hypothetical protein
MRWVARIIVPSAAVALAIGCAAITGIDDAIGVDGNSLEGSSGGTSGSSGGTSGSSGSSGTSGSSGSSGSSGGTSGSSGRGEGGTGTGGEGGAGGEGGGVDAADSAPACPRKALGVDCTEGIQCCSDACAENHKCVPTCKSESSGCSIGETDDCCIGTYCSVGATLKCTACLVTGATPESYLGVPVAQSCCSRSLSLNGKCN